MGRQAAALARLLAAQGQEIEDRVRDGHAAIATRVFGVLGPTAGPVRQVHDLVGAGVHAAVRAGVGLAGRAGARAADLVDDEVVTGSRRGTAVVGAVLGLAGTSIRVDEPDLDWPTQLRTPDGTVVATHGAPPATSVDGQVVVLLHGLCETEQCWSWGALAGRPALHDRLDSPGRTVLLARVNSGRRPAEVGRELASLLDQLVDPGGTLTLVGHSMGGLVGRAALRAGEVAGHRWVAACRALVTLGTPHLGAPLEQAVAVLVRAGARAPEVDAVTRWFEQRADGVRDLGHGRTDDDDRPGVRPTAVVALPPHVALHTVGVRLDGVLGIVLGDGLVRPSSAHALGLDGLAATRGAPVQLDGRSHFELLTDPTVGAHVAAVVDGDR